MIQHVFQGCILLVFFYLIGSSMSTCESPYWNSCGENENELNTTEIEDSAETICDCQQVRFCYIINLSQECNSTIIKLITDGNFTLSNLHCDILPLDSLMKTPSYVLLDQSENDIVLNILTDFNFGTFKISCLEMFEEFNITNNMWEIVSVDPSEIVVDSQIELKLTVVKQIAKSVWCFVKTPDKNIEVLYAFWESDTQINCKCFKPVIPGLFQVSLHSEMISNIFDKSIDVNILPKSPIAEKAEYSFDYKIISIYFDENIELHSSCVNVFSKEDLNNFGNDFDCFTKGNILVVKMGKEFQIVNKVSINSESKICRAGSSVESCVLSSSAVLTLFKPKILEPRLSLYMNPNCGISSEKYINVNFIPTQPNQTFQMTTSGKTQRKNLIMWKTIRKIQNKFSSPLIIPQSNTTEVPSILEDLSSFDDLEKSLESASVSLLVQSFPSSSSILAEANVTFCDESKLYWYRWIVNKKDVLQDGKVIILKDLTPGIYVIKCLVVGYNSSEIFGQGWATTEILPNTHKVIVTPSEITLGTRDNITLKAVTRPRSIVSWSCKTTHGQVCITTDQKSPSEVLDLNSLIISIPGGIFPVGDYIWSVENAEGANTAKVFIKPGDRPSIDVEVSTSAKSTEGVVLRGKIKRAEVNCQVWWSSVRQKGFNYLKIDNMREREEISTYSNFPADLMIPPFDSDTLYMFKLQVFCPQKGTLDHIKIPLSINNPPNVSAIIVEPLEGFSMITKFLVSGGEVDASELLMFEWSYIDSCDEKVSIKRGTFSRNFTTYLPPGDLKLILKVCNEMEICSTTSTPTIKVIQESEFPAENFQKARNQIEFLLISGDILEGFGLATTAFKSLSLLHEPEFRKMMFSTVEKGIKNRIKELTRRLESDIKTAKLCLEFFEQAIAVVKYFRKGSDIQVQLTEFKNKIIRFMNSNRSF